MLRRNVRTKLGIERLENKLPLAADFTGSLLQAELIDGDLVITNLDQNFNVGNAPGNLQDQSLTITGDDFGNIDILVEDAQLFDPVSGNTLLSGETLSLSGFDGGIDADFGSDLAGIPNANNTFNLRIEGGLDVNGDVNVTGAADSLVLAIVDIEAQFPFEFSTINGSVSLVGGGPGSYGAAIQLVNINGDLTIDASQSAPQEDFDRGAFADLTLINVGGGIDVDFGSTGVGPASSVENRFSLESATVGGDVRFDGGDGIDRITVTNVFDAFPTVVNGTLDIDTQEGDDRVQVNFSPFTEQPNSFGSTVSADRINIDTGADNDLVQLTDLAVNDTLRIDAGAGVDQVRVESVTTSSDLRIDSGADNDLVQLTDLAVNDSLRIDVGDGVDQVEVESVTTSSDLRVDSGAGSTLASIASSTVGNDVLLFLGEGDDDVNVSSTEVGNSVIARTGGGVNAVFIADESTVGDDVRLLGDDGDDELEVGSGTIVGDDIFLDGRGGNDILVVDDSLAMDDIVLRGGAGDDELVVAGGLPSDGGFTTLAAADDVLLFAGADDDVILLENDAVIGNDLVITTGDGFDEFEIANVTVLNDARVISGSGDDVAFVENFTVGNDLRFSTGSGDDMLEFLNLTVENRFELNTGSGNDEVAIIGALLDEAFIRLGSGDDALLLSDVTIEGSGLLNGGGGEDTLAFFGSNDLLDVLDRAFENTVPATA